MNPQSAAIPSDWQVKTLAELGSEITSGSRGWAAYYANSGSLFVRITNLDRSDIHLDLSSSRFVKIYPNDAEAQRTRLATGDLLVSITADIGIIGYIDDQVPTPAYINQHIARVRMDPRLVDSRFVAYYLASWEPQRRFVGSTDTGAKAGMNLSTVAALPTVVPPLAEQSRIADALTDVDDLIAAMERMITKKETIKKGSIQQLLTGKTRLPGFVDHWRTVRLGDHLKRPPRYGLNAPAVPNTADTYTYIRITDIDDHGNFSPHPRVGVRHANSVYCILREGELVFARTGASVGKSYLYDSDDGELVYAGFLINIAPDSATLSPEYLNLVTQTAHYWDWVARTSVRSGQPGINGREYAQFQFTLPEIREQRAIVAAVKDINLEIRLLRRRLIKAKAVKHGMMQQLLTGHTRL